MLVTSYAAMLLSLALLLAQVLTSHVTNGGQVNHHCSVDVDYHGCTGESLYQKQTIPRGSPYKRDPRFKGVYTFPVSSIPTMQCSDPDVMVAIHNGQPVVLHNCTFAETALKWNIDYLLKNLRDDGHPAYVSSNRRFLYYDVHRMKGKYADWQPPQDRRFVAFKEFLEMVQEIDKSNNGTRSYFQSPLVVDSEGVSDAFRDDINSFDYDWLLDIVRREGWGTDVVNLLLVGMTDVVTPAHYDMLENFYVQVSGLKRVILFNPEHFRSLYPFPVAHPHDRQTQVNFDDPNFDQFPRFRDIEGLEAVLGPGDVLYLPSYWWHYIESENNNMTVSMNFWFEPKNKRKEDHPTNKLVEDEEQTTDEQDSFVKSTATSETSRKASETSRKSSETPRKTSETSGETSETNHKPSETSRKTSETPGETSETSPKPSETPRKTSETSGETSETSRKASETSRKWSEDPDFTVENLADTEEDIEITKENEGDEKSGNTDENNDDFFGFDMDLKPKSLSPAEYLALRRDVEVLLFKATHDHNKVRQLLDEILNGRFDFLDSQRKH